MKQLEDLLQVDRLREMRIESSFARGSVIGDRDAHAFVVASDAKGDRAAGVGVLRRVREQVREDMRESHAICVDLHSPVRMLDLECMTLGLEQRPTSAAVTVFCSCKGSAFFFRSRPESWPRLGLARLLAARKGKNRARVP